MIRSTRSAPSPTTGQTPLERRLALCDPVARYRRMVEIREVEDTINRIHEQGLAWGATHLSHGQEAVAVGIAAAIPPTDVMFVSHRIHGLGLALGVTVESLLAESLGRAAGSVGGRGGSFHVTETSVGLVHSYTIMGTQIPQAVGAAYAAQVRGSTQVAVAHFGDGSVNIGAFHEGLNLAKVWNVPVVFICENNQFAEFTHISKMTATLPISRRAAAYGIPSETVDGQNVESARTAVAAAIERARAGEGPQFVELETYRYGGHSRADKAGYRVEGELERWRQRDPIAIAEQSLVSEGLLDARKVEFVAAAVKAEVAAATEWALAQPEPGPSEIFCHVYAPSGKTLGR